MRWTKDGKGRKQRTCCKSFGRGALLIQPRWRSRIIHWKAKKMRTGTSFSKLVWSIWWVFRQTSWRRKLRFDQYHPMEAFLASRLSGLWSVILRLLVRASNRFGAARRVAISVSVCLKKDQGASFASQWGSASLDPDEVLTIGNHCLFSKQAREYMLACSITTTVMRVEQQKELRRRASHTWRLTYWLKRLSSRTKLLERSASDFDTDFMNRIIEAKKNNQYHQ